MNLYDNMIVFKFFFFNYEINLLKVPHAQGANIGQHLMNDNLLIL